MLKRDIFAHLKKIALIHVRIRFFVSFTYNYLAVAIENQKPRASRKRLMHFVQMVLNFDKMSRQINHDLQDADGV